VFGERLDYLILRAMAHRRNRATEAELDAAFLRVSAASYDEEMPKFAKILERFGGALPIEPGLRYLDMGCGTGELTIAFARNGVEEITGVDFLPRSVERARAYARALGVADRAQFVCADLHDWRPERPFDVLLSFDALEHVWDPKGFLARMADFLAPGGRAVLAFGPFFHSPFGDHMWDFFRVQVPWRGVLFSEQAMLRLRREVFRPTDPGTSYRDIAEGLNQLRYSDFLRCVAETGWRFEYLQPNAFLVNRPVLRGVSDAVMRVPRVRDYFAHNVYAVLRRR
jgi:SAM-dependent methyltransferase